MKIEQQIQNLKKRISKFYLYFFNLFFTRLNQLIERAKKISILFINYYKAKICY